MEVRRVVAGLIMAVSVVMSGCAVNRATATVDPATKLDSIKRVHVVKEPQDERGINNLIVDKLNSLGLTATTGPAKVKDVDALVTYTDKWMWDLTMYMIELTLVIRNPQDDFPLAKANSYHTSLTRQTPTQMVDEVVTNIWKAPRK